MRQDLFVQKDTNVILSAGYKQFQVITGRKPQAYRAGSFRWNKNTIDFLGENEVKFSFNACSETAEKDNYDTFKPKSPKTFQWANGVVEVPCGEVSINNEIVHFRYPRRLEKGQDFEKLASLISQDSGGVVNILLHSWSFLNKDQSTGFFYYENDNKLKMFDKLLSELTKEFDIIGVGGLQSFLADSNKGKSPLLSDVCINNATKVVKPASLDSFKLALKGESVILGDTYNKFDWSSTKYDFDITNRTWWWTLHQLLPLEWACGDWSSLKSDISYKEIDEFNYRVINNWVDNSEGSILQWHDHASAMRAHALSRWLIQIKLYGTAFENLEPKLIKMLEQHLNWLIQECNYSRNNNHGYEQSRIMLAIACDLPGLSNSEKAKNIAISRLIKEIDFAFTIQGVHKENSPGYHWFMINVLNDLRIFLITYQLELDGVDLDNLISKAEVFLEQIALFDNTLPLIGDTQFKEKQNRSIKKLRRGIDKDQLMKSGTFDYAKSGYIINRNSSNEMENFHFTFKSGHLANYHRHDDDLSIHVVVNNEVYLGDSGAYSHNKSDLFRQYVRSPYAHSTVFPKGLTEGVRNNQKLKYLPNLEVMSENIYVGHTYQYPKFKLRRRIKLVAGNHNKIKITDRVFFAKEIDEQEMISNFVIPWPVEQTQIEIIANEIHLTCNNNKMIIETSKISTIHIVKGNFDSDKLEELSFISNKMGNTEPAIRIEIHWVASTIQQDRNETLISFI
jgi:hypothetical protein